MEKSVRIQALIDGVPPSRRVADVGCDHGWVSLGLARRGDVEEVWATDISAPSLQKLEEQLAQEPEWVRRKITTRVTDGLQGLPDGGCDTLLIAGMGGELIVRIVEARLDWVQQCRCLLFCPHTASAQVRAAMQRWGFAIEMEWRLREQGNDYELIRGIPRDPTVQEAPYREVEWRYGRFPVQAKNPLLAERWREEVRMREEILATWSAQACGERALQRKRQLEQEKQQYQQWLQEVFHED